MIRGHVRVLMILMAALICVSAGAIAYASDGEAGSAEQVVEGALGAFITVDLYGEVVTPDVFERAELTMVNIWGTYCGPCINEMPDLGDLNREYADRGFQIVGIVVDVYESDPRTVEHARYIVEELGADYCHLIPDAVMIDTKLYTVAYIPTTFFVDSRGVQVGKTYGQAYSREVWVAIIEGMLSELPE